MTNETNERVARALALAAEARIELERLRAVLEAAQDALGRAETLEANGDRVLREAYDRVVWNATAEVLAAEADLDRAVGRVAGAERALQVLGEVSA